MFSLREGGAGMNPLDDAKPDYSSLDKPKQPVLSLGEWLNVMISLKHKIARKKQVLKSTFCTKVDKAYLREDIRITKALYDKLKEAGFSES